MFEQDRRELSYFAQIEKVNNVVTTFVSTYEKKQSGKVINDLKIIADELAKLYHQATSLGKNIESEAPILSAVSRVQDRLRLDYVNPSVPNLINSFVELLTVKFSHNLKIKTETIYSVTSSLSDYASLNDSIRTKSLAPVNIDSIGELSERQNEHLLNKMVNWNILMQVDNTKLTPISVVAKREKNDNLLQNLNRHAILLDTGKQIDESSRREIEQLIVELESESQIYAAPEREDVQTSILNLIIVLHQMLRCDRTIKSSYALIQEELVEPLTSDHKPSKDLFRVLYSIPTYEQTAVIALNVALLDGSNRSLSSEDVATLQKTKSTLLQQISEYQFVLELSKSILENKVKKSVETLIAEIRKYVDWLEVILSLGDTKVSEPSIAGYPEQDTLDGWISLIDRASTVVDLKTIVRSLMNKNYSKSGDDFTRLDKAPTGQGRFENQVWERWKQKVKSLGGREGEKNEYDFLLDRYTRIIRLYDFDIPYGNSRTRATNYTTGGAKEAITADEVAKTFSHQDLYYFLIPEDKIYVTEDGVKSPRYPGKIDLHFEHSKEIKELLWFMCLLDSELPDPSEDGLETSKRRGRYFGYNYTAHANSKVEMKREMKEYAKDSFIVGDDADVEELVEIAFSISTVLCIGMKKAILCRMAAISPRENEEAMYKELIKQISPEAAAFYSCQKHEKPLPEYASYAKFSERVLGDMHRGVGLNGKSRHEETEIYLHNLFASLENTMIFWETYNAPYRKDWVVFDYIEGTRLIRTPFPDLMQLFYFDIEGSFEKYISMSNYFTALEGHVEFHRILTSELRLSNGISADKATEKLIEQFTNLLSTFSKIKNVPVDWKYYGRLVLCFIDKMSFAFTHRNMKGNSPDGLDNPISLIESRRFQERVAEVLNTLTGQLKIQKEVVAMMTHTHAKADFYAGAPLTREIEDGGNVITLEDYWRTRLTDTSPEEVRRQRPVRKVRTSAFNLARAFLTGRQNTVEIVKLLHPDFQKHFSHVEFGSGDNVFKDSEGKDH